MSNKSLPEPVPLSFSNLISDIGNGILKIPNFQREFVWPMKRTIGLLDSISKGYPIGSFLIWETNEKLPDLRNIGNLNLPQTPEGHIVKYVLDGQQRITSLFACMKEAHVNNKPYALFYDLERKIFVDNPEDNTKEKIIPVSFLLRDDDEQIREKIGQLSKSQLLFSEFNRVRSKFREYRFATIQVKGFELDEVIEMFIRINTEGTSLSLMELMTARTLRPNFNLRNEMKKFRNELKVKHYDLINEQTILQTLSLLRIESCKTGEILKT